MKKGVLIIAGIWFILNLVSYLLFDTAGAMLSTYVYMLIIWIFRKKLINKFNL